MSYVSENFEVFQRIVKGIAAQFGNNCEVVLHDLSQPYDHTIVAIENGHITGRKLGDSGTNMGLEVLRGTVDNAKQDRFNYVNFTKKGRVLRSSSIYFNDEAGNVVGSLCINLDITDLIMAQKTIYYHTFLDTEDATTREVFTSNVDELLEILVQEAIGQIGRQPPIMTKEDKIKAIRWLDEKGAFLIKKSVERVSDFFGISKFTLYNYLDEGRLNAENKGISEGS
jgi:predicted transcriptional regulator YheO